MRMIPPEIREQYDDMGNAPHLLSDEDRIKIDNNEMHRASGECICETCGKEYRQHNDVIGALWLTKLCDGTLVKL